MSVTQSQLDDPDELVPRRRRLRLALVTALIAIVVWGLYEFVVATVPRHFVLASGPEGGVYHRYARRYKELLAREGVTVDERITAGADENLQLLLDPKSGVDVAFMQGGVAPNPQDSNLKMVASLYYEPLWVFYAGTETISGIPNYAGSGLPSAPLEAGLGNLRRPYCRSTASRRTTPRFARSAARTRCRHW